MKKLICYLFISVCTTSVIFAQDKNDNSVAKNKETKEDIYKSRTKTGMDGIASASEIMNTSNAYSDQGSFRVFDTRYEGLRGTPYFNNDWMKGEIIMNDGSLTRVPLKYDVYNKEVRMKRSMGDSIVVAPHQMKGFRLIDESSNTILPFVKIEHLKTSTGTLPVTFLYVIHNNVVGLFKNYSKRILKADYKGAYNSSDRTYDLLEDNSEYFFKKPDNSLVRVKLNNKSIIEAMSDKKQLIEDFLAKENLKIKQEGDVIKVIQYYESL